MFRKHSRIVAAGVFCFFTWTSAGVFSFAHAAQEVVKQGNEKASLGAKVEGAEERFAKVTEEVGAVLADPEKDMVNKKQVLRVKKREIDALDVEIKKEFATTEKKLKAAKLPKEILQRHYAFVKHYEDNLSELETNLNAVEKAKDDKEAQAGVEKAKKHLEQTKAPSRHQKIDPNLLPHRAIEQKKKLPRLKLEEFEKDFGKHVATTGNRKRIMIASIGSLAGLLNSDGAPTSESPTTADFAETSAVQFTTEISAKAQELEYSPVNIYNWVRNNIAYEPYYGSLKSAQQTLLEGAGNDFDQASLLIALLRVSNIAARHAYGTVEIPIEKAMNWVGGVSDPTAAASILATQGIPVKPIIIGGTIKALQLEHAWVEAWIDYFPSRGARHKQGGEDTWISLDPSFKQQSVQYGMDMYALMGFNGEKLLQEFINDTRDITAYQQYSKHLLDFIDEKIPDATIEQVFGASDIKSSKSIINQEFPFLAGTLPYKTIITAANYSQIPQTKNFNVTIKLNGNDFDSLPELNYSDSLYSLADKRVTVSYEPASSADVALVMYYGGDILAVPPYLLNVRPVLKVSGLTVATGAIIGLGQDQKIIINFSGPDGNLDRVENIITAGAYSAIILQSQYTPIESMAKNIENLIANSKSIGSSAITLDDLLGQMLYSVGISYFHKLCFENEVYAKNLQLISLRQPSEAMVTHCVNTNYSFGLPLAISEGGINIDVDRNINVIISPNNDKERVKSFMILSGLSSSSWEDRILESFFDLKSISTIKILKIAAEKNIPIYSITKDNINELISQLKLNKDVLIDIYNAVNSGDKVIVPESNIICDNWSGVGYVVLNSENGAAGYFISGGTSGGMTGKTPEKSIRNVSQYFWGDGSALKTIFSRTIILMLALAELDTPYIWGGNNPECGVDCSGFIRYLFTSVYGSSVFNIKIRLNAADQHKLIVEKKWIHQYSEKLDSDILWKYNYKHTGIFYGIPITATSDTLDSVIHASGRPCKKDEQNGWVPPPQCIENDDNKVPVCGKFLRVIITSTNNSFFGTMATDIGRPNP